MTELTATATVTEPLAVDAAQPGWKSALGPLVLDLGLPVAAYYVSRNALDTSLVTAYLASSVVSVGRMAFTAVRDRRLNGLSALVFAVNMASLALNFMTGDVRLMAARDAVVSSVVGFGILVSVLRGTPVMAEGMRPFVTKGRAGWETAWEQLALGSPRFRRLLGRHSAVWGIAFVLDCAVRVVCAATAPVNSLAWIGTVTTIGAIVVAIVVSGAVAADPIMKLVGAAAGDHIACGCATRA